MTARQYIMPGGRYADEQGRRTYFMPGFGYQTESNINVFNETLHEDLTLTSLFGQTYNETLAEALTASFGYADTVRYASEHLGRGFYMQEGGPPSFFVPGLGYYNSTNSRSKPVPGAFNFINLPLTESLTAGYNLTNSQGFGEQFRTLLHPPDLRTQTQAPGGGSFGQIAFGTTAYGGLANAAGSRLDQFDFGEHYRIAMLAPDLPEAQAVAAVGCYGPITFGTTPYGGNGTPRTSDGISFSFIRAFNGADRVVKVYGDRTVTPQ